MSNPHPITCLPPPPPHRLNIDRCIISTMYKLAKTLLSLKWIEYKYGAPNPTFNFVIINLFNDCCSRLKMEENESGVFVIGAQENISSTSQSLSKAEWNALPKEVSSWGRIWPFKRCQISATVYHSGSYKQVTARNNFTVSFSWRKESQYGSGLNYVKVQGKCYQASCSNVHCDCQLECSFFVLIRILVSAKNNCLV